ncbi:uncharacterized protein LOC122254767 isoform X2 [Penaeus japonicus]|uniref:uncharacterized protein LOC122254767 isoform X2 n=1 Tax=Penaeus japonicus TaxID=27405 RepID=UPI001C70F86D|nr:uncharacterized protein LOC122254767 isoform X2 [Penaeus japonicus]XP_042874562.1 uncharacterized protein LOC122254767 isoform X2 [Penaeus japonicus]
MQLIILLVTITLVGCSHFESDAPSWRSDPLSHFMHERGINLLAKGNLGMNRGDGEPQGRGPRDGQQRGQGERRRKVETEQQRNQGADVRAEGVNVLMHDVCGGKLVLDYEESAIIYSNNDQQRQSCSMKVKVSLTELKGKNNIYSAP